MRFYVTFGQRYAREQHPTMLGAHPNGWVVVEADDMTDARVLVVQYLGTAWSNIYRDDNTPTISEFPRGPIGRLTKDGLVTEVEVVAMAIAGMAYHCVGCIGEERVGSDLQLDEAVDTENTVVNQWALDTATVVLEALYKSKRELGA